MKEAKLESLILDLEYEDENPLAEKISSARSFQDAGIMTMNRGVVLRMSDGSEFQITIVQSAPPDPDLAEEDDEDMEGGQ